MYINITVREFNPGPGTISAAQRLADEHCLQSMQRNVDFFGCFLFRFFLFVYFLLFLSCYFYQCNETWMRSLPNAFQDRWDCLAATQAPGMRRKKPTDRIQTRKETFFKQQLSERKRAQWNTSAAHDHLATGPILCWSHPVKKSLVWVNKQIILSIIIIITCSVLYLSLSIYIYMYMCVYIYIYIYIYLSIYLSIYTYDSPEFGTNVRSLIVVGLSTDAWSAPVVAPQILTAYH